MNQHQFVAYTELFTTAETLREMISNARSQSHPLTIDPRAIESIVQAMVELHRAQRVMEDGP